MCRAIPALPIRTRTHREAAVPEPDRRNNYWPSSYSPKTKLLYIPVMTACEDVTNDGSLPRRRKEQGWYVRSGGGYRAPERYESQLTAVDPHRRRQEEPDASSIRTIRARSPTAGGVVFVALLDGTIAAYERHDARTKLWKINVGSGFSAPPMTFEVNGKQYMAIVPRDRAERPRRKCSTRRTQGPAPRNGAVCIRVVRGRIVSEPTIRQQARSAPSPPLGRGLG